MCARFSLYATPAQIAELLEIDVPEVEPQYNIAPTDLVIGAIEKEGKRQLREFRWGLIPSWAKNPAVGTKMINARSESILEKPAFRNAFMRRRCAIPANGFFEWKHETIEEAPAPERQPAVPSLFEEFNIPKRSKPKAKALKQPYFVSLQSRESFAFAGLYEYWRDGQGELTRSCTILTTQPNELIATLHDRMPVILRKHDLETWLDCSNPNLDLPQSLLQSLPASEMSAVPVRPSVTDPHSASPRSIAGI